MNQVRLGWLIYGWKLYVVSVVLAVWILLVDDLTPANTADNEAASTLIKQLLKELRSLLSARHHDTPSVWAARDQWYYLLVTSHYGRHPHTDPSVEV